jgi:ribosomal-protein-alanine N-acetyltransferase
MDYTIRRMRKEDIPQATEIDREAFTDQPYVSFHRELENKSSVYFVAEINGEFSEDRRKKGLLSRLKRSSSGSRCSIYIGGYAGIWILVDEAHISAIAVRQKLRQRGIGELLLMSVIEYAMGLPVDVVTLEVRASNLAAQSLYRKYGFGEVGIRRHYYTDNLEDALIMTTPPINSSSYRTFFQGLKQEYYKKRKLSSSRECTELQ